MGLDKSISGKVGRDCGTSHDPQGPLWMDEAGGHQTTGLGNHAKEPGLCPEGSGRLFTYLTGS